MTRVNNVRPSDPLQTTPIRGIHELADLELVSRVLKGEASPEIRRIEARLNAAYVEMDAAQRLVDAARTRAAEVEEQLLRYIKASQRLHELTGR